MFGNFSRTLDTLLALQDAVERKMDVDIFGDSTTCRGSYPPVNLFSNGEDLVLTMEISGINKEDITLELKNNLLRIAGKRKVEYDKDASIHRAERGSVDFDRTVKLPFSIEDSRVKAEYEDGVLIVHLPKAEKEKPKQISVA